MSDTPIVENVLGKYRLIAELGRGGMAEVYLALVRGPAGFSKLLVIKRLRSHLRDEADFVQMFLDEARLAARLSHPNIVQTIEVGESAGQYYISMEYLEGQPLNRILRRCRTALTRPMVLRVICDALSGLHHAHDLKDFDGTPLNVVHRDATPHNIFVTYNGVVKVVDFGIAKAANSMTETRAGVLKGKVSYMAPEQARSEPTDRRADIFSIGCCLWEILAGQRVWKGKTDLQVLNHLMGHSVELPLPSSINPDVPEALEALCMRAMSIDPADRPQTALELRDELESYLESVGDKSTVAQAAKIISKRFEAEQTRLKSLIETQTKSAASMPSGEYKRVELPRLPSPSLTSELATPMPPSSSSSPSFDVSGSGSLPSLQTLPAVETTTSSTKTMLVPLLLVGAAAVAGVGGWLLSSSSQSNPTSTAASSSSAAPAQPGVAQPSDAKTAPQPSATPSAAARAPVEISVTAFPKSAEILIDGKVVDENPFVGSFPHDDKPHQLEIRAEGFETVEREISFGKDLAIELTLKEAKRPIAGRTRPPAAQPPSSDDDEPTPGSALTPGPRKTRELDTSNPYAQ